MCKNPAMALHRVGVLALDGVVVLDLGVPAQVFGAARGTDRQARYEVLTCTPGGGPVATAAGFRVIPDHGLELLETVDTVIVVGIQGDHLPDRVLTHPDVLRALRAVHRQGRARLVSICTGAFVLAEAGVLDGRPATTHWAYADRFGARYPDVKLDPDVLFVDDGDLLTSAGVAAGIDLCLHIVRRDQGSDVANRAARRCVVAPWRDGGQAQFIERPVPTGPRGANKANKANGGDGDGGGHADGQTTAAARAWALEHLAEPLELRVLAEQARTSVRTFTRRFRQETGQSPGQWINQQRVQLARLLLEDTDLPIDQVASRCGFGTAVSLRQHLHGVVGVSPGAYRRMYRRPGQ
jgi:transcriptional regulator GlxA family with amidase domain